ncbi:hypothetical protein [uncultured Aquimarina sp.]|uniref:hypothetical protein n=1 Tax=uncultured Aquimarina sp. TaxID=575652 RepID=UPI00262061CF|nr:hypothetical protein [uncultured Aquimarina sp.]
MKTLKKIGLIFSGIALIVVLLISYLLFKRETKEWTENITVAPNTEISINLMSSQRGYFGGHGLGWGGGGQKNSIEFEYDRVQYEDEMPYTPISIKYYDRHFYIIYFDRETDFNKISFRFFKSTNEGEFNEIESSQFPKQIAIQNRWFSNQEKQNKIEQLQLNEIRGSLTAKVWYQLEKGIDYYEMPSYIPLDFLESYREKYIK